VVSSIKSSLESEKLSTKDYPRRGERSQFIFDGDCAMGVVNMQARQQGVALWRNLV
jgi:hypothetical protein